MKHYISNNRRVVAFLMSMLLVCTMLFHATSVLAYEQKSATIIGDGVRVRSGPSTSDTILDQLNTGHAVTAIDEKNTSDGYIWYKITYTKSGKSITGWVRSDLISVQYDVETDEDFEAYLAKQGFPESYKVRLRQLHAQYPKWIFQAQNTNLKWEDVIEAESELGTSLIYSSAISSWKSTQTGAYNWDNSTWKELDSGGWVAASEAIIKYYMDPRNMLDSINIFQFLRQSYDSTLQTVGGMNNIVKNTFLAGTYTEGGKTKYYKDTIMEAAKQSGVSPYTLASMIIIEQGSTGYGKSISGTESGYKGLYNFFNIGSWKTSTLTAVQRGLWYAGGEGVGNTSYKRPWDNRTDSIIGGAIYYGERYVKKGQDTLYLKKFNVQGKNPYTNQYMTNVTGAALEGQTLSDAFNSTARDSALIFKIPVYKNMPSSACPKPTGDGSPNYMLKSLSVSGYSLSPTFDKYTTSYSLIVPNNVSSVTINATAIDSKATISGKGSVSLSVGSNAKKVVVKAENGSTRTYTITIVREGDPNAPAPTMTSSVYDVNHSSKTVSGFQTVPTTATNLKKDLRVTNGTVGIYSAGGTEITGNVGTGMRVKLFDVNGTERTLYYAVVYGDTNGDGSISMMDYVQIRKQILGQVTLVGKYLQAADTNKDGSVAMMDYVQVRKHILNQYTIEQ